MVVSQMLACPSAEDAQRLFVRSNGPSDPVEKPTDLIMADLVFNEIGSDDTLKAWDWRNDPLLALEGAKDVERLARLMALNGIDPDAAGYLRREKKAVFLLAREGPSAA